MPSVATPTASEDCCPVTIAPLPAPARSAGEHDPQQHREREALALPRPAADWGAGPRTTGLMMLSALPVAELRGQADALATRLPRRPGRSRTPAAIGLTRPGNRAGQQPTTRQTQCDRAAGRACTSFAWKPEAWKPGPRREQSGRSAWLHRPRDRRRPGAHGDHKVVRPTRIRAPGSRYARRALRPGCMSAGGLVHD